MARRKSVGWTTACRAEYDAWRSIKHRCFNPNAQKYHRYGGRGITMCEEWKGSFLRFLTDVGRRPSPEHSIDRIDNDGNYEPGNVKWSTRAEQQSNMAKNTNMTLNGRTQTLSKWSRELGIPKSTISTRLARGWSEEDALAPPKRPSTARPSPQTPEEIAEETGLPVGLFEKRRAAGWSIVDAVCIPEGMTREEYRAISQMESSQDGVL